MKCKHCGANISLEDEKCPFCGQPNEMAAGHASDMKQYQQEFTQTKGKVLSKVHKWGTTTQHAVILGILLFLNLGVFVARMAVFDVVDWLEEMEVKIHEDVYYQQLSDYEAEGEYTKLAILARKKSYMGDTLREFSGVQDTGFAYKMGKESIAWLTNDNVKGNYLPDEYLVECLAEALEKLRKELEKIKEAETAADSYFGAERYQGSHKVAIEDMDARIRMLLEAYCNMTPEEIEELIQMPEYKKAVFIGERLGIHE